MALTPDDPSGYQRLIVSQDSNTLRGMLTFEVVALTGMMLFFARWSVYLWSFGLFIQLAFNVGKNYIGARQSGYDVIADGGRRAIIETLVAFAVITAFVLIQSRFQLWFAQEPLCYRSCPR
ncbi:MAG: hypothetical protein ACK4UQ_11235 [Brevundimonas sp.]